MKFTKVFACMALAGLAGNAFATNGMNMEGYGPIAAGMGGASMAYDNGTAAMMNNPATLGLAAEGSRLDVALGFLGPDVTANCPAATCGADVSAESGGDAYFMPAIGYTRKNGALTYGVGLFAQGGMGTEYEGNTFMSGGSGLDTRSELGVGRLIFPLAYNITPALNIGGSLDFVWSMLDLQMALNGAQFGDMLPYGIGTQTFGAVSGSLVDQFLGFVQGGFIDSSAPLNWGFFDFSDNNDFTGKTKTTGWGGKIGFTYKVSPALSIGGTYHTKTSLGDMEGDATVTFNHNFSDGLGGYVATTTPVTGEIAVRNFEWPETYGLGLAYQVNDRLMVAADYKRINWKDVMKSFKMSFTADAVQADPIANMGFAGLSMDATLFQNWDDQDVFAIGFAYKATDALTLRAGANFANNPIPDMYMNPLFPAIVENHYTVGLGYDVSSSSAVNFSLSHAPEVTQVSGSTISVDHSQTNWQLMYSKRF